MISEFQSSMCDLVSRFSGEMVRVITGSSHYRGECLTIDVNSNNIFLKDVVRKIESGWVKVTDFMLIHGPSIETIYIELGYPFEVNESLIFSVEDGKINHNSEVEPDHDLEGLL